MMMHISRRYDDVHAHYSRGMCKSRPIVALFIVKIIVKGILYFPHTFNRLCWGFQRGSHLKTDIIHGRNLE